MIAEAPTTTARPDPAWPPAGAAYPPGQHWCQGNPGCGPRAPGQAGADPPRDDTVVADLVTRARHGDKQAWDELVTRYAPLVWSICRRHRLSDADAQDAGQEAWLRLVGHLDKIRDPAALPGWLATVTRRECLRVLRTAPEPLTGGGASEGAAPLKATAVIQLLADSEIGSAARNLEKQVSMAHELLRQSGYEAARAKIDAADQSRLELIRRFKDDLGISQQSAVSAAPHSTAPPGPSLTMASLTDTD